MVNICPLYHTMFWKILGCAMYVRQVSRTIYICDSVKQVPQYINICRDSYGPPYISPILVAGRGVKIFHCNARGWGSPKSWESQEGGGASKIKREGSYPSPHYAIAEGNFDFFCLNCFKMMDFSKFITEYIHRGSIIRISIFWTAPKWRISASLSQNVFTMVEENLDFYYLNCSKMKDLSDISSENTKNLYPPRKTLRQLAKAFL